MTLARRTVLAGMVCAAALTSAPTGITAATGSRRIKRFGIQLYTLREVAKADPMGTLRRLKALGYGELELGGPPYSMMDPKVLRRELVSLGLTVPSMHVPLVEIEADAAKIFEQANILGAKYVVVPWIDPARRATVAQCQAIAATLTRLGQAAKSAGLTLAYHNHSWEFEPVEGKLPFDIFFGESDPALVKVELDLFWAAKAKADIPAIFAKYAGRIPLCHVKDMAADGSMVAVGAGIIDFGALFARSQQAGLLHYFVEHDNPPAPYWPTIETSAAYMKSLRY